MSRTRCFASFYPSARADVAYRDARRRRHEPWTLCCSIPRLRACFIRESAECPCANGIGRILKRKTLAICFQSVAELWSWAVESRWNQKERRGLEKFLRRLLFLRLTASSRR